MKLKRITLSLALLAAIACQNRTDQRPSIPEGSIIVAERLSNQQVNGFTQDKDGHIWIATRRGLNKYTGSEFYQYFSTDDTLGLPDNQITAVHAAHDGTLWAGSVNGLAFRTPDGTFRRVSHPTPFLNVSQILESQDGQLLISTGATLYRYNQQQNGIVPVIRDFNAFSTSALIQGKRLWSIADGGFSLHCYSTEDFSLLQSFALPFQGYHLCSVGTEELWLSGMGELRILNTRSGQWETLPPEIRSDSRLMKGDVDLIFEPEDRSLLLRVIGKGFFYYDRARKQLLHQTDPDFPLSIPDTEIRTLFRDRNGNLWMGTADRGFYVSFRERGLFESNKSLTKAFQGMNVTALCPDKSNGLWACTLREGLLRYDLSTKTLQHISVSHLIPDSGVGYIRASNIFCDADGDLWLLFQDKVRAIRCQWDGKRLIFRDFLYVMYPISIAQDDRGALWIGGFSSTLTRYDKNSHERRDFPLTDTGEWTFASALLMQEPGKLLVGCFNMPPVLVNTYSLEMKKVPVTPQEKDACIRRSTIIPNCLRKDSAGDIWIGTYANGLIVSQNGHRKPVEGTPCPDIASVEEDHFGNIWVSTLNGIGKYDRTTGRFVHYFEADGIGGNQFNDRSSCVLGDGTLVFGGTHGITCFNPLDTPAQRSVPVVFESLSIHNRLCAEITNPLACITLRDDENAFGISFAALDYSPNEQIRYAYKLEGFDKDWVKTLMRHDAYFANIPPGDYTLKVRISDGSQSITETETSLPLRILPPWYASWWAISLWVLLGLFFLGMGYTYYRHVRRVRKDAARRIRDERREREKAEEAEKAEKALNRIQQNYFANVAHEFRTPLTMIAGPAQQLTTSTHIQGEERQLVNLISRNATWMLSLVNQLLDFNRIGNSKLQMKVAKMDIVQPLRDIAGLFRFNAESKGIELGTYGLEEAFTMWVDADKVQKIVMNLLSNALKFTPSGGKVTLGFDVISRANAVARFPLTERDTDGQWACISVSDTGPGVAQDQLEKIFERFYQAPDGKKSYGSGIGLYYARALCLLHHGYIKAWNKEEGGALFSLILPVSATSYTDDERSTEQAQALPSHALAQRMEQDEPDLESGKRHIAVVDDDIDIANYLKVLLKQEYRISLYFEGAQALKGMAEDVPDLIISDVMMPGLDGYELCSRIKGDLSLSHIPVVLVTAKVAVENQVQGLDKGADAYVTKPFQPAYLLALVKSLLENREKLRRQLASATTTEDIAPEALSPRDATFMKDLYDLMDKELANADLDIVHITEMMKISRTKFYYKVKGLTGENPSVFFKRYKLNRAADLLKEGKYNMSEIAWMTGFNTLSHFSTSFKKQFGVPPSEYIG